MKFWILVLAFIWWWHQNHYFGWSAWPKSDAELMADGITFLLVAVAMR
jgi:hypothetical protein